MTGRRIARAALGAVGLLAALYLVSTASFLLLHLSVRHPSIVYFRVAGITVRPSEPWQATAILVGVLVAGLACGAVAVWLVIARCLADRAGGEPAD